MTWHLEFYHEGSGTFARHRVEATTADEAVRAGRRALLVERPVPEGRRRRLSLFARAQRATAHDDSGWVLYRMRRDDVPEPGSPETPVTAAMPG